MLSLQVSFERPEPRQGPHAQSSVRGGLFSTGRGGGSGAHYVWHRLLWVSNLVLTSAGRFGLVGSSIPGDEASVRCSLRAMGDESSRLLPNKQHWTGSS